MKETVAVVDIGTTKISITVAKIDNGVNILYLNKFLSSGLKKGKIIDMEAFTSSIKKAIQTTEESLSTKLKRVIVCFSIPDIKGIYSNAAVKIKRKTITYEDVSSVIELATAVQMPSDREIIHILPIEFIVDGSNGIKDPIGMKGLRLETKVYIVTTSSSHIQNIKGCFERLGIEVEEMVLQAISSSEAVLTEHDREVGTLIVDFGGGTTDIALFYEGYIRHIESFGIGSNHITNDLTVGLKIPFKEAERIKTQFGVALPDINFGDIKFSDAQEVEIMGLDRQPLRVPLRVIKEIVYPRLEEIFEILKKQIDS
ncbi:MAG: cell division protein FtsA, partial [Thermodesulfovibrionaceae bacterium]